MQKETTVGIMWYGDDCFLFTTDIPKGSLRYGSIPGLFPFKTIKGGIYSLASVTNSLDIHLAPLLRVVL